MPVTYTPPKEGDDLSVANMSSPFTALRTGVNALEEEDVERGALRDVHLPNLINTSRFTDGLCAVDESSGGFQEYANGLAMSGGSTFPVNLQGFSSTASDPGGLTAPYGPLTEATISPLRYDEEGWRIVCNSGSITYAIEVPCVAMELDGDDTYTGCLVRASCNFRRSSDSPGGANVAAYGISIGIGWEDTGGNKYVIERSVRHFSSTAVNRGDISTFAYVEDADLNAGVARVTKFFLVFATCQFDGDSTKVGYGWEAQVDNGIITVWPMRAGSL